MKSNTLQKKQYEINNLDCALCAEKIEQALQKKEFIKSVTVNFITKKLTIEGENVESNFKEIINTVLKIEPGASIVDQSNNQGAQEQGGKSKLKNLLIGAIIYAVAIIISKVFPQMNKLLSILIFVPSYIFLGYDVVAIAVKNITKGLVFDENFLMSVATIGAFALKQGEEAVAVMLFYKIGEYFEHRAVEKSRKQIRSAMELRPQNALVLENDQTIMKKAENVAVGEIMVVKVGDRVALDGVVVLGKSWVDNAAITGESTPVEASVGNKISSGAINKVGLLHVKVEKVLGESMITRILDIVENAAQNKPQTEKFITKFSKIYTPIVCLFALAVAFVPPVLGFGAFSLWGYRALVFLVVSCPCALVLSVPMAFFAGVGKGSKNAILFKGGAPLEAITKIRAVVFDKTGTITNGEFKVLNVVCSKGFAENEILKYAGIAEKTSTHPIAMSIFKKTQEEKIELEESVVAIEVAGEGIVAKTKNGKTIVCGSKKLLKDNNIEFSDESNFQKSETIVYIGFDNVFAGYIELGDSVKQDAKQGIDKLKKAGIKTYMLTGDNETIGNKIGKSVGIEKIVSNLTPQGKLEAFSKIRDKNGASMFVGDGINDAPVISISDVGVAMGSGSDIAIESADIVLLNKNVSAVAEAIKIGKTVRRIATQNIVAAIGVKLFVMALGVMGIASIWMAVFADTGISLLCVANSLRIVSKDK